MIYGMGLACGCREVNVAFRYTKRNCCRWSLGMVSTLHLMVSGRDWSPFYDVGLTVGRIVGSGSSVVLGLAEGTSDVDEGGGCEGIRNIGDDYCG